MLREFRVGAGLLFPAPPRRSQAPLAQVPGSLGAGVFLEGGPAPQIGLLRPSVAQVPTHFPHLRQTPQTPAPNTPDTCAKNRHHLRQPSCFPVVKGVFRQNAAREGRSYAPGWGLRCANCRSRHLAHRNHRHKAQEGAPCAPVWRRAATGLPARQGFPVGLRALQWHIAMLPRQGFPAGLPVGPGAVPTGGKNRGKLPHRSLKWTYGHTPGTGRS